MEKKFERQLLNRILIIPVLIVIFFFTIVTFLTINYNDNQLKEEIEHIQNDFIQIHKEITKKEVEKIYNLINFAANKKQTFLEDFSKEEIQKIVLKRIESMRYDKSGYIFIIDYKGDFLINVNETLLQENQMNLKDRNGELVIQKIIQTAKNGGGFISYFSLPKTYYKEAQKISFIKAFEPWDWAIGYGFHPNEIQPQLNQKIDHLKKSHKQFMEKIILINFILTVTLSIVLMIFSNNVKKVFNSYKHSIKEEEEKNKEKDSIIYHQSKMATIGELLNIISHQWRQPLSQINSLTLDTYLEQKHGTLNEEVLKKNISNIENITEYLSQTIDDFSNFFIQEKDKKPFMANDAIKRCIKILYPSLKDIDITIDTKCKTKINGFITLFQQVILTIITNSLDAFNINHIENPSITIKCYDKENFTFIEILDNAGGIDKKDINNIFDLYFSTKTKKTPTGLGLYIAKKIIKKNMNGDITARNKDNGVKFTIKVANSGTK